MTNYIGYGFDTNEINKKQIADFIRTYDKSIREDNIDEINEKPDEEDEILYEIVDNMYGIAEYLRDTINGAEKEEKGIKFDIVECYDNFLVFDSICFAGETPRADYIRTRGEFIGFIEKYFPGNDFNFGNVYDGVEWADPCYFLDN